jgi:hypothetical protein
MRKSAVLVVCLLAANCAPLDYCDFRSPVVDAHDNKFEIDHMAELTKKRPEPVNGYVDFRAMKIALSQRDWKGITRSGHAFEYTADNDAVPMKGAVYEELISCAGILAGDDGGGSPCQSFGPKHGGMTGGASWWIHCEKLDRRLCWAENSTLRINLVVDAAGPRAVCYSDGWRHGPPVFLRLDQRQWTIREVSFSSREFDRSACLTGQDAVLFFDGLSGGAEVETAVEDPAMDPRFRRKTGKIDPAFNDALRLARFLAGREAQPGEKDR